MSHFLRYVVTFEKKEKKITFFDYILFHTKKLKFVVFAISEQTSLTS